MKEEVEDEHDNQNEGSPSSKARRFRSHLMVAGPIGRVAHKYHNDSENSSNFGKEVLKGEERGEKAGRGIVRSFFTGAEASRKKQDVSSRQIIDTMTKVSVLIIDAFSYYTIYP